METGKLSREEKIHKINQLIKDKKELEEAIGAGERLPKHYHG